MDRWITLISVYLCCWWTIVGSQLAGEGLIVHLLLSEYRAARVITPALAFVFFSLVRPGEKQLVWAHSSACWPAPFSLFLSVLLYSRSLKYVRAVLHCRAREERSPKSAIGSSSGKFERSVVFGGRGYICPGVGRAKINLSGAQL